MTIEEVRAAVEHIRENREDDEYARGKEKELWHAVLETIANGAENPRVLAVAALRTWEIRFTRWI